MLINKLRLFINTSIDNCLDFFVQFKVAVTNSVDCTCRKGGGFSLYITALNVVLKRLAQVSQPIF
jgi:hypothetical protein